MKKILSFALSALCLFACNNEMTESVIESETVNKVTVTVAPLAEKSETRTVLSKDANDKTIFVWSATDEIGIFPNEGYQTGFSMASAAGSVTAEFTGGGWGLKASSTYAAYYPFIHDIDLDKTAIPLDYTGQTQTGNGNSNHLAAYDFMTAPASIPSNGTVNFNFGHLGTLLHFKFTMPEAAELTSIILKTNGELTEKATLNLTTNQVTATTTNVKQTLLLENVNVAANGVLDAYMMISAVNLSGKTLEATVTNADGETYVANLSAQNFVGGDVWNYTRTLTDSDAENKEYMSFTAMEDNCRFMLMDYNENNPDVMISTSEKNWITLEHGKQITINQGETIYFKGENPHGFSKSSLSEYSQFATSGKISVRGNIMSLIYGDNFMDKKSLPYDSDNCFTSLFKGTTIITAPILPATELTALCYESMFENCTNLLEAPKLPATTLATGCYENMFKGCTSLVEAPQLRAMDLKYGCYWNMFWGCTGLTSTPDLPATELASYCYNHMFYECTNLQNVSNLPAESLADYCYSYMFYGCSKISSLKAGFISIPSKSSLSSWLNKTSSQGTFYRNPNAFWTEKSEANIPDGWAIVNY